MQGEGGQDQDALEREVMSPFSMFHQGPRVVVFSALELLEQALHGAAERLFRPVLGDGWEQGVLQIMWNAKSPAERARLDRPSTLDLLQLCKAGKNVDIFRAFLYKAGIRGYEIRLLLLVAAADQLILLQVMC
jgi:hypothetical protein